MIARLASVIATVILATSLAAAPPANPKNVILIVGDGMGAAHFSACRLLRGAEFRIGTMPVAGLVATSAADRAVTDSAAAATAFAIGTKTNYEMLSVDPSGAPRRTVLELAELNRKSTGVVTTSYFFDATPAAFAAHAVHRKRDPEIIDLMLKSGAEIIVGSGLQEFGRRGIPTLADAASQHGYVVESTAEGLLQSPAAKVIALFEPAQHDADFREARLADLARAAIERLSKDRDGFFLLVEHEGTDTGSHRNNGEVVRASLASLDEAVGVALDFAARDGATLVIVTGDHETGGLRLSENKEGAFRLEWSTTEHTAAAVPLFAFGPGADRFGGFHDNDEIGRLLLATQE